jgi:hypothetical protein
MFGKKKANKPAKVKAVKKPSEFGKKLRAAARRTTEVVLFASPLAPLTMSVACCAGMKPLQDMAANSVLRMQNGMISALEKAYDKELQRA